MLGAAPAWAHEDIAPGPRAVPGSHWGLDILQTDKQAIRKDLYHSA
jgi:hypothetical protein